MKLDTFFDSENEIIVAKPEGDMTSENVKLAIKKTMELSGEHDCYRLLFDITLCREAQPLIYGYQHMKDGLITGGMSLQHICAVVYNPELYPEDRADFIENVVINRTNPKFKMFKTADEAVDWLKSNSGT